MDLGLLTLDEKTLLLAGDNFWEAGSVPGKVAPLRTADGPHGLRRTVADRESANREQTLPATCYPTESTLACSFDADLVGAVGRALGAEARAAQVDVLLGPGLNIKRDPRGGRNFEYFSEDPYLSGLLGAAYIRGVQSQGVAACPKHFAANNQVRKRMVSDSVVDARTLHELYLPAFEQAVREGDPWMLMGAYNRLNGTYCCENPSLLALPRTQWGFTGAVVTDWGALSRSVESVAAGLSLCMPGPRPDHVLKIRQAVAADTLPEAAVDAAAGALLRLRQRIEAARAPHGAADGGPHDAEGPKPAAAHTPSDDAAFDALAQRAARESAVLLQNDGILPLAPDTQLAVVGAFAEEPRIQGGGSSQVNPRSVAAPLAALRAHCPDLAYAAGYDVLTGESTHELAVEAARVAQGAQTVVVFLGQAPDSESEGYDRTDWRLPDSQCELLRALHAVNPHIVIVLQAGAPVDTAWRAQANALLLMGLAGAQCGPAVADLLYGQANPSGKLAETWPERLEDTPCGAEGFPDEHDRILYRESLYVGYRWYDAADLAPAFPFGHGLSYTQFAYRNLVLEHTAQTVYARVSVTNTGTRAGAEAVQLYVAPLDPGAFAPPQQLQGVHKVHLEPGQSATVEFSLDARAFSRYDATHEEWYVEEGTYEVRIGSSSRDIRLRQAVFRAGRAPEPSDDTPACYRHPAPGAFDDASFAQLLGRPLPALTRPRTPLTIDSPASDLDQRGIGRAVLGIIRRVVRGIAGGPGAADVVDHMLQEVPLRAAVLEGFVDFSRVEALVALMNRTGGVVAALRRNYGKRLARVRTEE